SPEHPPGRGQVHLRADVSTGPEASYIDDAHPEMRRLLAITISDMPADPDDASLLLDAVSFRHCLPSRADAWRHVGIDPERGRRLLTRNKNALDWPIFFTLRHAALGE